MSEKGLLSKSIANNISEAITDKLGGAGYAPTEWRKNINLLGIASEDSDFAIASLQEEASTSEKGALSLSIASDVGTMLNKKYNTSRGFKPSEVSSAVSMLSPLPEKTASGAIAVIEDGADDVPTKSAKVTIPATLSGVSAVSVVATGKNLLNPSELVVGSINSSGENINSSTRVRSGYIKINGGQKYAVSIGGSVQIFEIHQYKSDFTKAVNLISVNAQSYILTASNDTAFIRLLMRFSNNATIDVSDITELQVQTGDTVTAYEPYTPTTYTASLGRTIYGGSADLVSGEGVSESLYYELDENDTWSAYSGANYSFWHNVATGEDRPIKQTEASESISNYLTYSSASPSSAPDFSFLIQGGQRIVVTADSSIDTVDKFKTWLSTHKLIFVCPASTPESFTFEAQEIPTKQGYNAFWSDEGDTEVVYCAIQTPYERGTLTGGIVNFDDADTNFPLVKLEADLAPTLDGKSAVEFTRCGKNLLQNDLTSQTVNGTTFTVNDYKSITISGTPTAQTRVYIKSGDFFKVKSTSFFSCGSMPTGTRIFCQKTTSGGTSSYPTISPTSTFNEADAVYSNMLLEVGTSFSGEEFTIYPMIEVGSSASDYTPYVPPTVFTASFGRTIYGGSADIEKGEGQETYGKYSITGQETGDFLAGTNNNGNRIGVRITGARTPLYTGGISNIGENKACLASSTWTIGSWCIYTDNKLYFVVPNEYTNFATALQYLVDNNATFVFPLATPEDFTFDAQRVEALPGVNNFYNDIGDTDIEYIKTR